MRIQFISTHISSQYDALKLTVLNRTDGPVDTLVLKLKDLLGKKAVPSNPNFRNGVSPHIWDDCGKADWYVYHPTAADYKTIQLAAQQYLEVFRDRQQEHIQDGPKLAYICAPLWGDVEKNIAFARQKAQEVFHAGDMIRQYQKRETHPILRAEFSIIAGEEEFIPDPSEWKPSGKKREMEL